MKRIKILKRLLWNLKTLNSQTKDIHLNDNNVLLFPDWILVREENQTLPKITGKTRVYMDSTLI